MWINRFIEPILREQAATHSVVVLTGTRQAGKTSLMRRVFPALSFVSLELPSKAEQAEGDPDAFLARHPSPVVIDEVQYAPALIRHLHVAVQRDRDRKGALLLTGSVPPILLESVSESLAGRVSIIQLEPLSYAEAKAANPDLLVEEFLVRGGFPELCAKPEIEPCDFYRSYVPTYLERDLCQLLRVSSLRDFEGFLRAAALKTAQLLNRTDLARDVGISGSTAFAWISVLEASYQLVLLKPWFGDQARPLVKRPKLYLQDPGLASFLCGLHSAADLRSSPFVGALWETLVCAEIRLAQLNRHGRWDLNFWHDGVRKADFLLHREDKFDLADAKWTQHPQSQDAARLRRHEV